VKNAPLMCQSQNIASPRAPIKKSLHRVLHTLIAEISEERISRSERKKPERGHSPLFPVRRHRIWEQPVDNLI